MSMKCGILANGKRDAYPLVTATCKVSVVDVNVHAKLRQTYVSTSSEAQEVVYVFPLPADAAVCAFSAVIDATRTIRGQVKERHQAKRDYDEAVSAGKTAALLEQHSTQVFQVSLGNLKPGQTIVVDIEFVSLIAHAGILDSLRLKLPVTVAPLYGTAPSTLPSIPRVAGKFPFELEVSFQMSGNITAITSDTHPVSVRVGSLSSEGATAAFDATLAHVLLSSHTFLDADIVLEVKCAGLDAPRCTVQRLSIPDSDDVTDALSLTLAPRFAAVPVPKQEYLFLVDRSGSMDGGRIAAVRNALQIMLRSLPSKHSTFNVFSFGQRCDSLWPEAVAYDKDSVEQASTYVESMSANYGGTEIAQALTTVFKSRERTLKEPAAVFLLTDGEAWDLKGVFKTVADAVAASDKALRVFVLGVGDQVSTEMCDGIARAGRGVVTYVREREKPDAKLVGLVKAARSALVQDVSVDWGVAADFADDFEVVDSPSVATEDVPPARATTTPVSLFDPAAKAPPEELGPRDEQVSLPPFPRLQQAPMHADALPPLYPGFRCNVFALIRQPRDAPLPQRVAIRGTLLGSPAVLEVPVAAASVLDSGDTGAKAPFVHVLAARALVQDIEDLTASTGAPPSGVAKAKIARLGTTYGIASSQTSFVAIDEFGDPEPLQERHKAQLARLKDDLSEEGREESDDDMGFGIFDDDDDGEVAFSMGASAPSPALASDVDAEESDDDMGFALWDDGPTYVPVPAPSGPQPVSVGSIARYQQFDGSFPADDTFVLDGLRLSIVPTPPRALKGEQLKMVWHTMLALAYLEKHFASVEEQESWAYLAEKAREFITETLTEAWSHLGSEKIDGIVEDALVQARSLAWDYASP